LVLVFPDGDPTLAAEPVFHDETPTGVQAVAVSVGHTLSKLPELLKDFTGYFGPEGGVEAEAAMGVVVKLAGSQTAQAAQVPVVEFVGGQFDFQGQGQVVDPGLEPLFIQDGFEVPHAALDGPVVAG
jgi:hypothetical protein